MNPFLLCVAGEASGDRIGESIVTTSKQHDLDICGVGGPRMQRAGLVCLAEYHELAVNGFWDVIPRLPKLRRTLQKLRIALMRPECKGLVCVDYPGFNIRLFRIARELHKPIFWVAPPQIWAWKAKRVREFVNQEVHVFFAWEFDAYKKVALPILVRHPLLDEITAPKAFATRPLLALLPGSRWPQARRNGDAYLKMAQPRFPGPVIMIAPDEVMAISFQKQWGDKVEIRIANQLESAWDGVSHAICPPGTITLELALRGIRTCVFSRVDLLSYFLGRFFLKIPYLALPNLILGKKIFPEFLVPALGSHHEKQLKLELEKQWASLPGSPERSASDAIWNSLQGRPISEKISSFIQRIPLDSTSSF